MTDKTLADEKSALLKKRDELNARLEAIKKDYQGGLEADSEEQAVQLQNADVLEGIAKVTAEELEKVERQLAELA